MADENILVEFDYQNISIIDPNKVIDNNNEVIDRVVDQEDLVMYANLEAKMIPRTKLAVGRPLDDDTQNVQIASINFLRPGGYDFLTDTYTDEFTGKVDLEGKGLNQKARSIQTIQQQNKDDEYFFKQDIINNQDTNLLGIESISITNDRSNTPTVDITLIDIQGRALFEKGDQSPYAAFFNLPYPTFYLTLKGYYGKAIKYQLNLVKFSALFDGNTGNYRVSLKFYGYKFTVLADTSVAYLFALPFMYKTKYEVTTNAPSTAQQNAAQTSNNNPDQTLQSKIVFRGRQKINEVYSNYKEQQLIAPDFPELTLYELNQRLDALETNILSSFGQVDFTPLSNIDSYYKLLTEYRNDISSSTNDSFLGKYMDEKNFFIDTLGRTLYTFKKEYSSDQAKSDALTRLKSIIQLFNKDLAANPTCGTNGTYEVNNQKISSSITNTIDINDILVTPNDSEINWEETYIQRNGRTPTTIELLNFKNDSNNKLLTQSTNFINSLGGVTQKSQFFVFDGPNSFDFLINKMFSDITKVRQEVEATLQERLKEKLEGPNGLGFKPTLRNLFAVIFASVEGFYRLMDDVHRDAWDRRFRKERRNAIIPADKTNISTDSKDTVYSGGTTSIPVYPWPQYFRINDVDGEERYELRYPGDPKEVSITKGNDYYVWPEVEFVEEYIKAYTQRLETNDPNGDSNESETILRISLNSVEFPMSNLPYTDKEEVKYFYEIYERILMGAYFERLSKDGGFDYQIYKVHSDLEAINIIDSLSNDNPYLSKKLKEYAVSGGNYLQFLQTISNQGTGLNWQSFIRGLYNTRYIRGYVEKDFGISSFETLRPGSISTTENAESLDNVRQYLESTRANELDLLDVAPFTDLTWSQNNLSNGVNAAPNRYETRTSLRLNNDKKMLSNYDPSFGDNYNRPFTNYSFLNVQTPVITNFADFYNLRYNRKDFLPTEGLLRYPTTYSNGVTNQQTISMLNTPYFINALQVGINKSKTIGVQYPYVEAAYLFLNSLPLSTLREKYNSNGNNLITNSLLGIIQEPEEQLDYIFATLKKFGGVHRLPYAWILKYGSIWHRYKTWRETGVDILAPVWGSTNYVDNYDPITNSPTKVYSFTSGTRTDSVILQDNVTTAGVTTTTMNVGFYPKLMNDLFYFTTGFNLFTNYSDAEINGAINIGLNLGYSRNASINEPFGVDSNDPLRNINSRSWYSTFSTGTINEFKTYQRRKTLIFPSFGSTINQTKFEIFTRSGNNFTLRPGQDIVNNSAVFDGSSRLFWAAPVYGYYDTTTQPLPPPDAYLTEISSIEAVQSALGILPSTSSYTKIEEVFGTFKKQILDDFETEFLNYCRDLNDIDPSTLGLNQNATNFQSCLSSMLLVDEVPTNLDSENYIQNVSNNQVKNIGNQIQNLMNYNISFRYGNPGEHNRQVFGTFSNPKVIDPITYNQYVFNTLPGSTGTITLTDSELLNPRAWSALYTNVGFSTINGLEYTNNGSYYTDFFIDNNVEFTESNVTQFATLIKIYGTQKLNNNGSYNSTLFTQDINNFINQKDNYVSQALTQLFFKLQRQLPNVDSVNVKPINSAIESSVAKIEYWETFKAFNDKWIAGNDYKQRTLFEDVMFLDRANRDIGDKVYFDIFQLKSFLFITSNQDARVIDFLSKIIAQNRFYMMPMPAYINFWGINDVRPNTPPISEGSNELANSLFGTFTDVDPRMASPKLVCFYAGKPSEHLQMKDNTDIRFQNDTFNLSRASDNPMIDKISGNKKWWATNKVVGFNVDFGNRNQSMFYNLQLDQLQFASTTESNKQLTDMSDAAGGRKSFTQSIGLYNLYKNRSYECTVESMGNVMIQPTMYFNLRHVPMFNGPYMIQNVKHNIEAGSFRTTFKGVRVSNYSLPKINDQIASINQNILSDLILEVRRKKQDQELSGNPSVNITSVGSSITTSGSYKPQSSSTCFTSLSPNYVNYVGTEAVAVQNNYKEVANILEGLTLSGPEYNGNLKFITRAMVFFTMYLNGIKNDQFFGYNYNYGGVPAGGYLFSDIKYGGSLNTFFDKRYICMDDGSGNIRPYMSFNNLNLFMDFIVSYYKNKSAEYLANWNNGEPNYPKVMSAMYIKYWPTQRFKTQKEIDDWTNSNESSIETTLDEKAKEVLVIMKKNNLL